jgi:cytochrome P450
VTTAPPDRRPDGAAFDPFDPATRACPYAAYRRLRDAGPVARDAQVGIWYVSGHREAGAVLRDRRFSASHGQRLRGRPDALPVTMLSSDPPEHTRLRGAVAGALGSARVARLEPGIRERVVERVAAWPRDGTVDAVQDFAVPVVADALGRLLGIPVTETDRFGALAAAVAPQLDPLEPPAPGSTAASAMDELVDWFADLLAERLGTPGDDALGALVRAYEAGRLSAEEVRSSCALLVVGGFEPLVDLIGIAIWLLLEQRDGAAPTDARAIVEESLRLECPIHFAARVPVEDIAIGGTRVPAGDPVVVLLGAANRDPERFGDPDHFDLARRPNPHLAFGAGVHGCLGAAFSRMVARIAVGAVMRGAPSARLAGAPVWRASLVPRGLAALDVLVGG